MMITEKFYQRMTALAGIISEGRLEFIQDKFKQWADGLYKQVLHKEKAKTFNPDTDHPEGGTWSEEAVVFPKDLVTAFAGKLPPKPKYDKKIAEIFELLIGADPLPNKQNSQWIVRMFTNNLLVLEDLYKVTNYLTLYEKVKQAGKIPVEQRDINKFKSLPELYDIIAPFEKMEIKSKSEEEKEKKLEGAEKVFEDSHWLVIMPKTEAAACLYGMDTQWCTTSGQFKYYHSKGPLYILFDKTIEADPRKNPKKKLQFHFETHQYMDARDHQIDVGDFFRKNKQLVDLFDRLGKIGAPFKLEHKLLAKEEVMVYLRNPKKRLEFIDSGSNKFGAQWIFDYLEQLGETEEIRKILFEDPAFLKKLLEKNQMSMLEYGFKKLKSVDKDMLANFLYDNPVFLDYFSKLTNNAKEVEEYIRMLIKSGEKGEKYAIDMFMQKDTLYNMFMKHKKLVDYYNILQKGVFGKEGSAKALDMIENKKSKYRQDYLNIFGDYSLKVMIGFLRDVHTQKAKKKSLEETFSIGTFKEQFMKDGTEYLNHLGFSSAKKS